MKTNKIYEVLYEYEMGEEWLSASEKVLANSAESAIEKAKKEALAFVWADIPDTGKNKGKEIEHKCSGFRLLSLNLLAEATL